MELYRRAPLIIIQGKESSLTLPNFSILCASFSETAEIWAPVSSSALNFSPIIVTLTAGQLALSCGVFVKQTSSFDMVARVKSSSWALSDCVSIDLTSLSSLVHSLSSVLSSSHASSLI